MRITRPINKDDSGRVYPSNLNLSETFALQEIYDLYLKRLLDFEIDGLILGKSAADLDYIKPQTLDLRAIGLQLCNLMELHEISERDIESIAQLLSEYTS